jgi:hypothetical protein
MACEQAAAVADWGVADSAPGRMGSFAETVAPPGSGELARGFVWSDSEPRARRRTQSQVQADNRTLAPWDWRGWAPRHRLAGKSQSVREA